MVLYRFIGLLHQVYCPDLSLEDEELEVREEAIHAYEGIGGFDTAQPRNLFTWAGSQDPTLVSLLSEPNDETP